MNVASCKLRRLSPSVLCIVGVEDLNVCNKGNKEGNKSSTNISGSLLKYSVPVSILERIWQGLKIVGNGQVWNLSRRDRGDIVENCKFSAIRGPPTLWRQNRLLWGLFWLCLFLPSPELLSQCAKPLETVCWLWVPCCFSQSLHVSASSFCPSCASSLFVSLSSLTCAVFALTHFYDSSYWTLKQLANPLSPDLFQILCHQEPFEQSQRHTKAAPKNCHVHLMIKFSVKPASAN